MSEFNNDKSFLEILSWLEKKVGISITEKNMFSFNNKLRSFINKEGMDSIKELVRALSGDFNKGLHKRFINYITVNHTSFFREESTFDYLLEEILLKEFANKEVRIWSCASSTGQELYTLASLIRMHDDKLTHCKLLGTDVDCDAIKKAEQGLYKFCGKIPSRYHHFFHKNGEDMIEVDRSLKQLCMFRKLNLLSENWPMKKSFHVILCRNVLYYFNAKTQIKVIDKLYEKTVDNGWLITSITESIRDLTDKWTFVSPGIYRKKV